MITLTMGEKVVKFHTIFFSSCLEHMQEQRDRRGSSECGTMCEGGKSV